ncbi:tetratricopeptide (TPR) repeat protein [Amycolatopsis bartoniae]|uniref:AAA+ ATPase domain-containing protein n=1 Tax=Amycolatopsis bartoniae TaxID=941986 RepID=A0A8H9ITM1_9PSEU|nr:hypothetical protein [Amycolatopsis bartoniae]MBB2937748.1 tetratricopeptide (TPR) repeat protein [Amycolatopsis bartoniae]TVT08172.1 hypothetical protein FNH07_13295 [Amycolatopsis bartoniae]GHF40429.1 hypothetical protein GCM10017566_12250 [Amycolatopsis bartoniae]
MTHDVYLSFDEADRGPAESLARALRENGLDVFVGEEHTEVDAGLAAVLLSSRLLLAYYSARYSRGFRCQWELTTAALQPGPAILAVNPEPGNAHVAPVGLREVGKTEAATVAAELVRRVPGAVRAAPPFFAEPAWRTRPERFSGRFAQLWRLHSLVSAGSRVVVHGPRGAGKTALVRQYAALFGPVFPGGIHWLGPVDAAATLAAELRDLAVGRLGLRLAGAPPGRVPALVTARLDELRQRVLLIVDDVPAPLLDEVSLGSPFVRTVLTSRVRPARSAGLVELAGLFPRAAFAAPLDESAHRLLALGTLLAAAPIPLWLGEESALSQLVAAGFAQRVFDGWLLDPGAREAGLWEAELAGCARSAADALLAELDRPVHPWPSRLRRHAAALAGQAAVPLSRRLDLLRSAAAGHEAVGELSLAAARRAEVLALRPDDPGDLLAAARVELGCGNYAEAHEHARRAAELADGDGDDRVACRGRFVAMRALDLLGEYERADVLWTLLSERDGGPVVLARVAGLRLRGRPDQAFRLLAAVRPGELPPDAAREAQLEVARLQLLSGDAETAARVALDLMAGLLSAELENSPLYQEAAALRAEAVPADDPLGLAVRRTRAAVRLPPRRVLAAAARGVADPLPDSHPLTLRLRFAVGRAHERLRQYDRGREVLAAVLPRQVAVLGRDHPETAETRLALAVALIMTGEPVQGLALVREVAASGTGGPRRRALVTRWLFVALPRRLAAFAHRWLPLG